MWWAKAFSKCRENFSDDKVFLDWNLNREISIVLWPNIYPSFLKNCSAGLSNRLLRVQKIYSRIKFSETFIVWYFFPDLSKTFLDFRTKEQNFGHFCQCCILNPSGNFWWPFFMEVILFSFFEFDQNIFWLSKVLSKLHFGLLDEEFMERKFFSQ